MQALIYFIQKYKYFLFFLCLELVAFTLVVNNHQFHKSKIISSANLITGTLFEKKSLFTNYLQLKKENDNLVAENSKLKNQLEKLREKHNIQFFIVDDSVKYHQKYTYTAAKVINNNYHLPFNFLTINKGQKQGIKNEMAVINNKGIIGVTESYSDNYSRVLSILNKNSKINARLKNSTHFGTLTWNGKNYNIVQLLDLPRQALVKIGDTILTGGKSTIFPEGIPIGSIINIQNKSEKIIDILLFNDMSNLNYVYVVKNLHKKELKKLESSNNE